jgi:hypothetical protein
MNHIMDIVTLHTDQTSQPAPGNDTKARGHDRNNGKMDDGW